MAMADQHDIFSKRISRINKGTGPNLMGQMLVGAADTSQHGKRSSKKHVKRGLVLSRSAVGRPKAPLIERLLGAPLALILGAVLIANIGVFQMYSAGRAPLFDLPVHIVSSLQSANGPFWAALAVATLAILMFKIFSVTRLMAFALGFGAMIYGESLLQDRYPALWAQLYAPQLSTPAPVIQTEGTEPVQPIVAAQNL